MSEKPWKCCELSRLPRLSSLYFTGNCALALKLSFVHLSPVFFFPISVFIPILPLRLLLPLPDIFLIFFYRFVHFQPLSTSRLFSLYRTLQPIFPPRLFALTRHLFPSHLCRGIDPDPCSRTSDTAGPLSLPLILHLPPTWKAIDLVSSPADRWAF